MRTHGPDSSVFRIRRVWVPWRRRMRDIPDTGDGWTSGTDVGDDPLSALIAVVLLILLLPVLLFLVLATVEILLLALLVIPFAFARSLFGIPWVIQVSRDGAVVHTERVKGWFASRRRMQELAGLASNGRLAYVVGDEGRVG